MLRIKDDFYGLVAPATGPPTVLAEYLVWYENFTGGVRLAAHQADGTFIDRIGPTLDIESVGRSFYPSGVFSLMEGTRASNDSDTNEVIVRDWLDDREFTYTPPSPRVPSSPIMINGDVFWFELTPFTFAIPGTNNATVLLFQANEDLSGVTQINSFSASLFSVSEIFPDGFVRHGADWTNTGGLVWLEYFDANGEELNYVQVFLPYSGGVGSQSSELFSFPGSREFRSGYPVSTDTSVCLDTPSMSLSETITRIVQQYSDSGHTPGVGYISWGDSPGVVDISLSSDGLTIYTITGEEPYEIKIYDRISEALLQTIPLDRDENLVLGIHHLETLIVFPA